MASPAHSTRTKTPRRRPKQVTPRVNSQSIAPKNKNNQEKAKATVEYYSVRSILDESENDYLIDWEDNLETGEGYRPTWEPKSNANEAAIADWELRKLTKSTTVTADSQSGPSAVEISQDIQPIRTVKRKRKRREPPALNEPPQKRGKGRLRGAWNKRQTGFNSEVPELKPEEEENRDKTVVEDEGEKRDKTVVEDEAAETHQEDPIATSSNSIQLPFNQEISSNPERIPISSSASANDSDKNGLSRKNTLAPTSGTLKTPVKRDIVPDSQETLISVGKPASSDPQDHRFSVGQANPKDRAGDSEAAPVSDEEESWEEPPSYRERAKYLEGEKSNNSPCLGPHPVDEHNHLPPQIPGKISTEGQRREVHENLFQAPGDEPGSSNRGQVRVSEPEPIIQSLEQLTSSLALSEVHSQNFADDSGLHVETEDDVGPDFIPPICHISDSLDQETDEAEELQLQTRIPYTTHSINNSTQSTQERPSSHESAISITGSLSPRNSKVESSEPWQGGQVVPQEDPASSESSHNPNFNLSRESETVVREQQVARGSLTPLPAIFSHRQISPLSSQLDSHKNIPSAPQSSRHASLFDIKHIIVSVEDDPASKFPPPHLIPSSGRPKFPETYRGVFSPRPNTSSDHNMEGNSISMEQSASPRLSISERLRQIRAQSSTHMSTRSPSAIPERLPAPLTAHPGQMLPSKQHHIEPEESFSGVQPPLDSTAEDNSEVSEVHSLSKVPQLGKMEYLVPLPMVAFVRDVYAQAVKNCKTQIKNFISSSNADSATVESIDNMIDDLRKCSTHQDLLSEPSATQAATPDQVTAKWADTCSTKCIFLRHFLNETRNLEAHVVVLGRPGQTLDIIESILKTDNISYDRPGDRAAVPMSSIISPLKVTLLPTGEEGGVYIIARADMVIGFDDTFDASEPYIQRLRADLYGDKLTPLVSLIIVNSVEHLDLCIPRQMDPYTRKSILVSCIAHTVHKHEFGMAHPEDPSPDACATRIAQYLAEGSQNWPLLPLLEATSVELYLGESAQATSEHLGEDPVEGPVQEESGSTIQSHDTGAQVELQVPLSSLKRSWDVGNEDGESAKRLRATPQPESNAEATCISDTTIDPSQVFSTPAEHTAALDISSRHENSFNDSPTSWQARISELESQLRSKANTELQLRSENQQLRKDISGHENGVRIMQPKFQEALNERAAAVHEAKISTEKLVAISSRLETRNAEITRLKENEARLETELNAARQALATSAVPRIAELEKAHAQTRAYLEEKNKAERKLENKEKDFNFTRNSYQEASSRCGELSTEVSVLKEQNAILARQADENKVVINKINHDQALAFHVQRIKQLQDILEDREEELARKYEELRLLKEGRRGTRGTSVPKSPRINTGVLSPKVTGNRSRAGSPSVSDIGTAAASGGKDPMSFLSGGGGTGRFPPLSRLRE